MKTAIYGAATAAFVALAPAAVSASTFAGEFYDAPGTFATIDAAIAFVDANDPTATFRSTAIDYPNGPANTVPSTNAGGTTTLGDFLGVDAGTIVGDAGANLGGSVFVFTGLLDLSAGTQTFSVGSDDGFSLTIDGDLIAQQVTPRPFGITSADADAGSGLTPFELVYFENAGVTGVEFSIDGVIVTPAVVPLPAGLPLLLTGLGAFAIARRKRKAA